MCGTSESLIVENDLSITNNSNYCSITILSGATLTITNNSVVEISEAIAVQQGGKLVLDDATLTNCKNKSSWVGIEAYGFPLFNQASTAVELKNGAVIENAEKGINTSFSSISWPYSLSGAKITSENSSIRNCEIGVNFGTFGYSGTFFSWTDQSSFSNTNFIGCNIGVKLTSNLGTNYNNCTFEGVNSIGIEVQNSQVSVSGCEFDGYIGIFFSATWPSLIGSIISSNTFLNEEGIFMEAQGNAISHEIKGNFFASPLGISGTGQSSFYIQNNDFAGTIGGISSSYTGDDFNIITNNDFIGNINGCLVSGNNNIEYTTNCFNFTSEADIYLESGASIFTSQGDDGLEAGNCFSISGGNQISALGSVPFDYFLEKNTSVQSCKQPGTGNFSVEDASDQNILNCGSGVWSHLPPYYRNCLIPFSIPDKKTMESALKAEITRIKNDNTIPSKLKKWLIARYERCLKRLRGLIGIQIINEEQNGKEKGIEYFSVQPLFSHKIMAYAIIMEAGEYQRASLYLNSLIPENSSQAEFITANNIYQSYLTNRSDFVLSNASKSTLKAIAVKPNELSGYARTIYYILTGERLRMNTNTGIDILHKQINKTEYDLKIESFPNPILNNKICT